MDRNEKNSRFDKLIEEITERTDLIKAFAKKHKENEQKLEQHNNDLGDLLEELGYDLTEPELIEPDLGETETTFDELAGIDDDEIDVETTDKEKSSIY